jgi:hypothetical protein
MERTKREGTEERGWRCVQRNPCHEIKGIGCVRELSSCIIVVGLVRFTFLEIRESRALGGLSSRRQRLRCEYKSSIFHFFTFFWWRWTLKE